QVKDINTSSLSMLQSSLVATIASATKSVVSITISKDVKFYVDDPSQMNGPGNITQQTAKVGGGSGIIASKQGYIITNKHVVQDTTAKYSVTLYNGKIYNVDKIWFDDLLDLAILKIVDSEGKAPTDLIPASFLSLDTQIDVGQFVLAIGNSLSSYSNNVTMGIIGGKNKQLTINKNNLYIGLYQTDALVNPGNSGGPLIDINGNVLGITTAITEGQGIAFALPISKEFITSTLKSIENFGKISRPIIGIQYIDITPAIKQENKLTIDNGIYLKDVLADLPASQAGLKIGDIILAINKKPINTQLPFLYQLYTYIPGDTMSVDILRGNENLTFNIFLGGNTQ
ncbi:MAG: trypsin-like peptidase domain-containing protein, partial [candidate division SR1 bacterium]|nr:trypsin-like peptidase domain-containing protein [candidate division SR1 bacterium]